MCLKYNPCNKSKSLLLSTTYSYWIEEKWLYKESVYVQIYGSFDFCCVHHEVTSFGKWATCLQPNLWRKYIYLHGVGTDLPE